MYKIDTPSMDPGFFGADKRPYYIATGEWSFHSVGVRHPIILCHILNGMGCEAYITAQNPAPGMNAPLLTPDIIARHKAQGRHPVAVYNGDHFGVLGNLLQGDVIAHITGSDVGPVLEILCDDALHFFWSKEWASENNKKIKLLTFPVIDETVFNSDGVDDSKRSGFAYYAHKYLHHYGGTISDRVKNNGISLCQDISRTQREIAGILRGVKTLFIYESTGMASEAALCGCSCAVVKTGYLEEYFSDKIAENPRFLEESFEYYVPEDELDMSAGYKYTDTVVTEYMSRFVTPSAERFAEFIKITQSAPINTDENPIFPVRESENSGRVFLFGTGRVGLLVYNYLQKINVKVDGFVVLDECKNAHDNAFLGVPLYSLSDYRTFCGQECRLILAAENKDEQETMSALDACGVKYTRYGDAFDIRSRFQQVMSHALDRFLKEHKRIYIFGARNFSEMIYNSLRMVGVEAMGFVVSDEHAESSVKSKYGLPVYPLSVFAEQHYDGDCGLMTGMMPNFMLEVVPNLYAKKIDYFLAAL